jgi:hypothetical protein
MLPRTYLPAQVLKMQSGTKFCAEEEPECNRLLLLIMWYQNKIPFLLPHRYETQNFLPTQAISKLLL